MATEGVLRQPLPECLLANPPPCSSSQAYQAELFGDLRMGNRENMIIARKLLLAEPHLDLRTAMSTLAKLHFLSPLPPAPTAVESLESAWPKPTTEPRPEARDWAHKQTYRCCHHCGPG